MPKLHRPGGAVPRRPQQNSDPERTERRPQQRRCVIVSARRQYQACGKTKKRQHDQRDLGGPVLLRKYPKNIPLSPSGKSHLQLAPSCPTEGRLAIVTNAGRDAVDAESALTNALEADGEVVWS